MIESTKRIRKMKERPTVNFYCIKCNIFFEIEDGTLIDEVKCPECGTYEVFIELDFDKKADNNNTPSYFS
ncbi:MAG: hypothetical protein ACTSO9_21215 [Candidatus Helarchaeota archaeon]